MNIKNILFIGLFLIESTLLFSAKNPDSNNNSKTNVKDRPSLVAGCSPARRITYLEFNNVRTRIETGGLWWQDRANNNPDYEVPKGSNSFALYAGGLWLAGTDVNGQLKAAVSKFGQGVDYWTGPLDTTGTAEINETRCEDWDRFFEISKQEVIEFVLYRQALEQGTVAEEFPDGYQVPQSIIDWPANGDPNQNLARRIAPYVDVDNDGFYDYENGDYPYYDLGNSFNFYLDESLLNEDGIVDCRAPRIDRSESATRPLFGDKTYWWVFNDKGNLHTESNAPSIGMEIHAQAFAFATNDAINDMTFYNFELINRSTFTLTDTYFASYVDPDLGYPFDDYVGCDVQRGFGYCYNGDNDDEDFQGKNGYGSTPAAIGIDFFEGPYQDADGIDNEVGVGPGEALNGLGYGDGIEDNERFGMRRFVYYNNSRGQNGDPELAIHYYNYMRGIWKNGQRMRHGGDGLNATGVEPIPTAFMFPGDSDPLHWGTTDENGVTTVPNNTDWTEANPGMGAPPNAANDRRFLQSAGPFTLRPGNVNDITVGVVFAQAETGGALASVAKALTADDRAQALFDNCFQVLDGPDAPVLTVQELNQELVLYLTNPPTSNNAGEGYFEPDPNIITPQDVIDTMGVGFEYDNNYRFQGYQIYQLRASDVSVSELSNPDVARLAFQCDVKDGVGTLVNYTFDEELQASRPVKMVEGSDDGIVHSFRVTEDLFAQGNTQLINYKTYYYIAIAYAYNNFKPYVQDQAPDPSNPLVGAYDGQKTPYLASRRSANGGSIESVPAIPHSITPESNGTTINSSYGDLIGITRLQGKGNGNNSVELTNQTLDRLMNDKNWQNPNSLIADLDYRPGSGPITVKVVDPLNVVDGQFYFKILDENVGGNPVVTDTAEWMIWREGYPDTVYSNTTIQTRNEQLLFDPNWGLSVLIEQANEPGVDVNTGNGYLNSRIEYEDPTKAWLGGVSDQDGFNAFNWILSGTVSGDNSSYNDIQIASQFVDPNEDFENVLGGTWSPYGLVASGIGTQATGVLVNRPGFNLTSVRSARLRYLNSTVIVFTKDKSKWTRSPVIEMQEEPSKSLGGDAKYHARSLGSVDKDGNQWQAGDPVNVSDPNSPSYISSTGMGWFPGYAIDLETGDRLNIAFGEDSWFGLDNGADMIWNPTSTVATGSNGELVWGGKHNIYVFRKTLPGDPLYSSQLTRMPVYDAGAKLIQMLNQGLVEQAFGNCNWVALPLLEDGYSILDTETKVFLNVSKPYDILNSNIEPSLMNDGRPVYGFKTQGVAVQKNRKDVLKNALDEINVVPNPYYAVSEYETSSLDNRVKFTNLPEQCNIKIYNMSGTLIREYNKSDPANYLDWDLSNHVGIPISSGVYIIHVDVPGVGEKILKWFGVMRPVDLNNF